MAERFHAVQKISLPTACDEWSAVWHTAFNYLPVCVLLYIIKWEKHSNTRMKLLKKIALKIQLNAREMGADGFLVVMKNV